jgi:hypothetical protein
VESFIVDQLGDTTLEDSLVEMFQQEGHVLHAERLERLREVKQFTGRL